MDHSSANLCSSAGRSSAVVPGTSATSSHSEERPLPSSYRTLWVGWSIASVHWKQPGRCGHRDPDQLWHWGGGWLNCLCNEVGGAYTPSIVRIHYCSSHTAITAGFSSAITHKTTPWLRWKAKQGKSQMSPMRNDLLLRVYLQKSLKQLKMCIQWWNILTQFKWVKQPISKSVLKWIWI